MTPIVVDEDEALRLLLAEVDEQLLDWLRAPIGSNAEHAAIDAVIHQLDVAKAALVERRWR